ncbi:hypothetical protein CHS0354_041076 [Potamilus streckersoni]|uniref:Uncharacterized protein n=1 Tax=Potamilus streckersoni TaxID=2493646 RepID=A0AAE0SDQ2_9BIVA|nr:hypothetical protein CHS0354_041076 [Potamilus streckersoni]
MSPSPGRQERNGIILDRRFDSGFCWRNCMNSIIKRRCSKNDHVADVRHFHVKFKLWTAIEKEHQPHHTHRLWLCVKELFESYNYTPMFNSVHVADLQTLKRIITCPCSIMATQHISLILASSTSPGTKVRNGVKDNRLLDLDFFMMTSEERQI